MRAKLMAATLAVLGGFSVLPVVAQDRAQSLADVRQELSLLYVEVQSLKTELSTTGAPNVAPAFGSPSQRLSTIEGEMARLTDKIEQLEFRINQIVKDGTNRIANLEFRLVELEGGDISQLGETTTLGGDLPAPVAVAPPPPAGGEQLAIGEQADFDAASAALEAEQFDEAAALFAIFLDTYPAGPLAAQAQFQRGEALTRASLGRLPAPSVCPCGRSPLPARAGDGQYRAASAVRLQSSPDVAGVDQTSRLPCRLAGTDCW